MANLISEKVIEDILSLDKSILGEILAIDSDALSLIARQRSLSSGRLDLLYLYENELLLIELKVTPFNPEFIVQIRNYFQDILNLQKTYKIISAKVRKILLVTSCTTNDINTCEEQEIEIFTYEPEIVLSRYYENFKELSYFLNIQSGDYGVVRIGLLKSTLELLANGKNIRQIGNIENRSEKTIRNRLSVATQLGLVTRYKGEHFLTDFGNDFLVEGGVGDRLSNNQTQILSSFVTENPFYSSITYTILSFLECVFVLAKSSYPVPSEIVQNYFVRSVGKTATWKTEKARKTASYIFSNYACELEFLASVDNQFYITPKGIRAILILQLNRSIKLIESQK